MWGSDKKQVKGASLKETSHPCCRVLVQVLLRPAAATRGPTSATSFPPSWWAGEGGTKFPSLRVLYKSQLEQFLTFPLNVPYFVVHSESDLRVHLFILLENFGILKRRLYSLSSLLETSIISATFYIHPISLGYFILQVRFAAKYSG
ncbi:hypothetical protein N431DRAFT_217263 [Stipitochalara longipes BDJ]|nr:hypothetical protein N431DRAFT_217263 [Stipitochalara longipes BDJ]